MQLRKNDRQKNILHFAASVLKPKFRSGRLIKTTWNAMVCCHIVEKYFSCHSSHIVECRGWHIGENFCYPSHIGEKAKPRPLPPYLYRTCICAPQPPWKVKTRTNFFQWPAVENKKNNPLSPGKSEARWFISYYDFRMGCDPPWYKVTLLLSHQDFFPLFWSVTPT